MTDLRRIGPSHAPVGILEAARRRPLAVLVPMLALGAAALVLGVIRSPTYTAIAELGVGRIDPNSQTSRSAQATDSIATGAEVALNYRPLLDRIAREARVPRRLVARRTQTQVLQGGGIEITAYGTDATSARRLANTAATALVSYLVELNRHDVLADRLLSEYVAAAREYERKAGVAAQVRQQLDQSSAAASDRLIDAVREREAAAARRDALRDEYTTNAQVGQSLSAPVQVVARADVATSDRGSRLQKLLILALGGGLLAGLCLATILANDPSSETRRVGRAIATVRAWSPARRRWAAGGAVLASAALGMLVLRAGYGFTAFSLFGALVGAAAVGYLLWRAPPWITISVGLILTPFSGHWTNLGLPGGYVAPDRILLLGGVFATLLRGPFMRDRPPIVWTATHTALAAVSVYVTASALVAGTLVHQETLLALVEAFGLIPFLVFLVGPFVFGTEARRRVLLGCLVGLGGYLGLTALFETLHATALVLPHYISDPNIGIHFGRARGPFTEAVSNGTGLFATGTAALIATRIWQDHLAKALAAAVALLCMLGLLFTLQRSVWLGGVVATLMVGFSMRELRPFVIPVMLAATVLVIGAFATVPNLRNQAAGRAAQQDTIWDRDNLNRAASNMVAARPLVGFGWGTFRQKSISYFRQGDFPLTAARFEVHNIYLGYAATLGLVGVVLWLLGVLGAIVSSLRTTGPPDLRLWRFGFLGFATYFVLVSSFVPPQVFPNLMFWAWAGLVASGKVSTDTDPGARIIPWRDPGEGDPGGRANGAARRREAVPA